MLKLALRGMLAVGTLSLTGCLLISPNHGQVLSSRTADVPFQAWTAKTGGALNVECMPTNRYGPDISSHGSWSQFATLPVSDDASRDLSGGRMYSASDTLSLPESCWYRNRSNGWYYTSVRVIQSDYLSEASYEFYNAVKTETRDDPECIGREVGRTGSWTAWASTSCYHRYTSGSPVKWLVMRTQN